jgi:hypothetical protein
MQNLLAPQVMRMVERIIVVCGGILCIYLGYLLFHIASLKQEGGGKFRSVVFEFTATKVGPGVFFALFGAYILYGSLNHPIATAATTPTTEIASVQDVFAYSRRDLGVEKLTELAKKLPTPEDREAAEGALKNIRANTSFLGAGPWRADAIAAGPSKQEAIR